jgi:hypothetical protein
MDALNIMDFLPGVINGTLREHYIQLFAAAGSFALLVGFVGAWLGSRFGARRALKEARSYVLGDANAQLAQLQQSIDTIALEVERISEAQRFSARLAAEPRQQPVAPAQPSPRVITPH